MTATLNAVSPRDSIAALVARGARLDPSFSWLDVWQEEHARAFTVAKSAGYDILADIHAALLKALEEGLTLRDFSKTLRPVLEEKGWWGRKWATDPLTGERRAVQLGSSRRLRTIFETNMRVSYAAGHWTRFERHKATRPFLRYVAIMDEATRPLHRRLHNLVLPVDHPFWQQWAPPNGWGCRCTLQQLSQRAVDRLIADGEDLQFDPPDLGERRFVNRRTGEITTVPDGIDPGWAYNPGKEGIAEVERRLQRKLDGGLLFDSLPRSWPTPPATLAEVEQLAAELAAGQTEWEESLDSAELDALNHYKGDGHKGANAILREDQARLTEMDEEDIEIAETLIEDLAQALRRAKLPKAITTFRGLPPEVAEIVYSGVKPGDTIDDPGFSSSSLRQATSDKFGEFTLEARYLAGTPAVAFVHFIPEVNHVEYEVLLAPGIQARVVERHENRLVVEVRKR